MIAAPGLIRPPIIELIHFPRQFGSVLVTSDWMGSLAMQKN